MTNTQKILPAAILGIAALAMASFAFALHDAEHYSLFGDASYVSPGLDGSARAVKLVSDTSPGYGGIDYGVESGMTFAQLTTLSTEYMLESDDTCVGGSPRFQINVIDPNTSQEKNIFAYFGTDSAGAACIPGVEQNTGDFLEVNRLLDTSQLTGGTFYDPYAAALTKYGSWTVTGIQVVTDSGWASGDGEHAVVIDNTLINATLFTYEEPVVVLPIATDKNQCKNGGWKNVTDANGNPFKNQGQCVSSTVPADKGGGPNPQ